MYVLACSAHNVERRSFSGTFEGIELKVLCVLGLKWKCVLLELVPRMGEIKFKPRPQNWDLSTS